MVKQLAFHDVRTVADLKEALEEFDEESTVFITTTEDEYVCIYSIKEDHDHRVRLVVGHSYSP